MEQGIKDLITVTCVVLTFIVISFNSNVAVGYLAAAISMFIFGVTDIDTYKATCVEFLRSKGEPEEVIQECQRTPRIVLSLVVAGLRWPQVVVHALVVMFAKK